MTPTSVRVARTLLFMTAALAALPPFLILFMSSEPLGALPYMALFFLAAAAFLRAGLDLPERPDRARPLAVSGAFVFGAMGTLAGFSLGVVTIPAAGLGVIAAWATFLHPPRRAVLLAFAVYVAIGIAVVASRGSFGAIWAIPTVLIWPIWLVFIPSFPPVSLFGAVAIGAIFAIRAIARPAPHGAGGTAGLPLAIGIGILAGAAAVVAFIAWAYARPDTSARFELAPVVLGFVAIGGLLLGAGAATVRSGSLASAAALGLGATMLLLAVSTRPAVTCAERGQSQAMPLEWMLTSVGASGGSSGSGSSETMGPGRGTATGELEFAGRRAVYRCEGSKVVEYREVR